MKIKYKNLANKIRECCDNAQKRIWIAVPFIGRWNSVERIIGNKWLSNTRLDVKLITDIRNDGFISLDTITKFKHKSKIKTLAGLHAKVYIIDDYIFITSANLTGTAFSSRYEILVELKSEKEVINIFEYWWKKAINIDYKWLPKKNKKGSENGDNEEGKTQGLKKLCELPPPPGKIIVFKDYYKYLNTYNRFRELYLNDKLRVLKNLPIYYEIDAFLNYLFHEHPTTPTKKYIDKKIKYRILSDSKKLTEINKYKKNFKNWLDKNPQNEDYRNDRINLVKTKLAQNNINNINWNDVEDVVSCLHCMKSFGLNKSKFLNKSNWNNNKLNDVINAWNNLLHNFTQTIEERMENCYEPLVSFGKSSIQELISLYYPDEYPVINRNSNSGLRFFGYDIKPY